MTDRIKKLTDITLAGKMYPKTEKTEFDVTDIFLSECERDTKRICEYILNQEPMVTEYQTMTGFFRFDGSVVGVAFNRSGHKHTDELMRNLYLKQINGLHVLEWQHATADYKKVLEKFDNAVIVPFLMILISPAELSSLVVRKSSFVTFPLNPFISTISSTSY